LAVSCGDGGVGQVQLQLVEQLVELSIGGMEGVLHGKLGGLQVGQV
jgi:hypothetical protein